MSLKEDEIKQWLSEEIPYLVDDSDYESSYLKLDSKYALVLSWESGKKIIDAINDEDNEVLCLSIREININDSSYDWSLPWDRESGNIIVDFLPLANDWDEDSLYDLIEENYNIILENENSRESD